MPITELTFPPAEVAPLPIRELDATTTIEKTADKYGIDSEKFLAVAKCEDPDLIPDQQSNYVHKGRREQSYGIFQIDLDYHPEISIASATDPVFASKWAAKEWVAGYESSWSCYTDLYEK